MQRAFKGVWIPKEIWLSKVLSLQEKALLVEIDSLDNEDGCFASNSHFEQFIGLSKNRCSTIIKSLEEKGFIRINYQYKPGTKSIEKRIIHIVRQKTRPIPKTERGIPNSEEGISKTERGIPDMERGYSENCEGNNTSFNNTVNNTFSNTDRKDNGEQSSQLPSDSKKESEFVIDEIIKYLNVKTGKNFSFSPEAEGNRKNIRARLKAGATLEQVKYVIDVMCAYWLNNEEMKSNLNPVTLFRPSNFDRYLNRDMPKQKEKTLRDLMKEGQIDLSDML